jgi:hypothetical protein
VIRRSLAALMILFSLCASGCLGRSALTTRALKFNLSAAESPWGREGLFVGMWITLVYPICILADLFVLNSMEFWSGTNPMNGRSAMVDIPRSEVEKLGLPAVQEARIRRIDAVRAILYVEFVNGDRASLDVVRQGASYSVRYRGVELFRGDVRL